MPTKEVVAGQCKDRVVLGRDCDVQVFRNSNASDAMQL